VVGWGGGGGVGGVLWGVGGGGGGEIAKTITLEIHGRLPKMSNTGPYMLLRGTLCVVLLHFLSYLPVFSVGEGVEVASSAGPETLSEERK